MGWPGIQETQSEQKKETVPTREQLFVKPKRQKRGLKVALYGPEAVGKTHTLLTFPPPIYVINFEPNGVVLLLHKFGDKEIYECPTWEGWIGKGKEDDVTIATESIMSLEQAINSLSDVTEGTIGIDSVTHLWRYAEVWMKRVKVPELARKSGNKVFEFDWAYAYALYRRLVLKCLVRPVNVVLTGQTRDVYIGDKTTGEWEARWMGETPHMVDVLVRMEKRVTAEVGKDNIARNKVSYISTIEKVRPMRELVKDTRIEIQDLTYDKLIDALVNKLKIPHDILGLEEPSVPGGDTAAS